MRHLYLSCFLLLLPGFFAHAQEEGEWQEWESLFDGIDNNQSLPKNFEMGLTSSIYNLDITFKRQRSYFGEYLGVGKELGFYVQPKLVGQVDMRFSFYFSQYAFAYQDSIFDLDVTMGLVRIPVSLIYTVPWKFVQPQFQLGFNLGHLVQRRGYIVFDKEDVLPQYWSSTITSGLHA
ncbi:MAG: hypothetical protein AAFP02_03705, partial [Bacteroidota bacterium]